MPDTSEPIVLSRREAVFLAALLGEDALIGVNDPFLGWLAEQVREEWSKCLDGMIHKGYIHSAAGIGSNLKLNGDIESAIRACCSPERYIVVFESGKALSHAYNIDNTMRKMACIANEAEQVNICVKDYSCGHDLAGIISKRLMLPENVPACNTVLELTEEHFGRLAAQSAKGKTKAAKAVLFEAEGCQNAPEQFIKTLLSPDRKMLITTGSMKSASPTVDTFALFTGDGCTLCINQKKKQKRDIVEIKEFTTTDLEDSIMRLIS